MSEEQPAPADRSRLWAVVRGLLGLLGIGAVVWIVNDVGLDELGRVIGPALPWMPLAVALELARVAMDGVSSRQTLGRRGQEVPWLPLLASHLVAFAVMGVAPAGRATAEAVKASLLARWIGGPTAAAMGTANQANVLISSGTFTIVSTAAAFALTGWSVLTQLLLLHVVLMNLFGIGLRAAARYERLGDLLAKRFPSIGAHVRTFHDATKETSLFPLWPVSSMMLGRLFQAAHYGVIAVAVGMTPSALRGAPRTRRLPRRGRARSHDPRPDRRERARLHDERRHPRHHRGARGGHRAAGARGPAPAGARRLRRARGVAAADYQYLMRQPREQGSSVICPPRLIVAPSAVAPSASTKR